MPANAGKMLSGSLVALAFVILGCAIHDQDRVILASGLQLQDDELKVAWKGYASRLIESEWDKQYDFGLRRIQLQSVVVDEGVGLATLVGCAQTNEWPRRTYETIVLAMRTADGWQCHHFEISHEHVDGPPTHCVLRR